MAASPLGQVLHYLRQFAGATGGEVGDGELLDRFTLQKDDTAFDQLVNRHGRMVLGVCRSFLNDAHDAEDAFQATFLVLVRSARSVRKQSSLSSWLYGVAYRTALKARAAAARRRREEQVAAMYHPLFDSMSPESDDDRPVLAEELERLPEKYRTPMLLCYLEGKTTEETAQQLGWPKGTVTSRLMRGRDLLRNRLVRRGVTLSVAGIPMALGEVTASAAVSAPLAQATLQVAHLYAASPLATGSIPPAVANLTEGVLKDMFHTKLKNIAALLAVILALGAGGAWVYVTAADSLNGDKKPVVPVVRTAQSGSWSVPTTWEGGQVPTGNVRVLVREGHRVLYDIKATQAIRSLTISGTVAFAQDKDTRLDAGLIKIQPGEDPSEDGFDCEAHVSAPDAAKPRPALEVGTPDQPLPAKHSALIRLVYIEGMEKESCPAIVCCGGRMDFHGAPLSRTWVKLGANAKKGDAMIMLAEAVSGWKIGDRIIVTGTERTPTSGQSNAGPDPKGTTTEERTIQAIDGNQLTLNAPLEHGHLGDGLYRGEVANLSRNVVIESADPGGERGHTMYHKYSAGAISYAEFRHLGKPGVLGRYALHYHLVGDTMRGSYVIGASIWDSGNRWLTIHGTNYLIVRDNVGYKSKGHGFFLEDGTEVYNVLDRNLAVAARIAKPLPKQVIAFDKNDGAGFWWANSLNTFTRNVATENGEYGFRYEAMEPMVLPIQQPDGSRKALDIRTLPFVRFDDNEGHSQTGKYEVKMGTSGHKDGVGPDTKHPYIIRNLLVWNSHYAFDTKMPCVMIDGLRMAKTVYGYRALDCDNHVYRNITLGGDTQIPFSAMSTGPRPSTIDPWHRVLHDQGGYMGGNLRITVDGLTFENISGTGEAEAMISVFDVGAVAKVAHFRNVKQEGRRDGPYGQRALVYTSPVVSILPKEPQDVTPVYLHDHYGSGRHAKVVWAHSKDFANDGLKYHEEKPLTRHAPTSYVKGDTAVAEVSNVEFPKLLDPVDDLPPTTVITHVHKAADGKLTVRGSTADNGTVKRVLVNGSEAKATAANFSEWEITLENLSSGSLKLEAHAEDEAGNVEKRPHVLMVNVAK
jgi:RNA polymerase sigma factor (sigma-70 family)